MTSTIPYFDLENASCMAFSSGYVKSKQDLILLQQILTEPPLLVNFIAFDIKLRRTY
jgi:hypothetical protein